MTDGFNVEKSINCPQCGDTLPLYFKHVKLVQCLSCKSTIFLENEATRLAGDSSVLAPEISLIHLNVPFGYEHKSYLPLGKIRYSYGRGFWEEWWLKDSEGNEYWLSIDEGDFVLEQQIESRYSTELFNTLNVGQVTVDNLLVTETGMATCEGFEGALPKTVSKGDSYLYTHLSGKDASLTTLELGKDGVEVYSGKWISPFDIKKVG